MIQKNLINLYLKPEFQVTTLSTHRSVAAFRIAADSAEEAKKLAERIVQNSILVHPEEAGVPAGVTDTVAHTKPQSFSVTAVRPALKEGGFDLLDVPQLVEEGAEK